ncbi:MAG: hypothetical protein AAF402_06020 [Pseudomonadota bacterium]
MNSLSEPSKGLNAALPSLVIVLGSFILAAWAVWIDPVLNRDAVKYLLAAEAFSDGKFERGLSAYKWPFYSLSVAYFHKLIPFVSLDTAAHIWNALLRGLGGIAFLKISLQLGASRRHIWIAVLIYLLFPGLNEVQSMVIRDYGYLCFFLWMVYFFLRQLANPTMSNVIGFLLFGMVATAFRIEGLVYVFGLLVFYLVTGTVNNRLKALGYGIIFIVVPVLCYIQLMWLYNGDVANTLNIFLHTVDQARDALAVEIEQIESSVLRSFLESVSWLILLFSPFVRMLWSTLNVLSLVYVIILIYGWSNRPVLELENPRIALMYKGWKWLAGMNVMVLVTFVMITQIVTDRYPLSLALLLMLLIPFIVVSLLDRWRSSDRLWVRGIMPSILGVFLVLNAAEGLDRFTVNHHIKDAGLFVSQRLKPDQYFLTNHRVIDYYAGNKDIKQDVEYAWPNIKRYVNDKNNRWTHIEWIVLYFDRHEPRSTFDYLDRVFGDLPVQEMVGEKGNRILIYNPGERRRALRGS